MSRRSTTGCRSPNSSDILEDCGAEILVVDRHPCRGRAPSSPPVSKCRHVVLASPQPPDRPGWTATKTWCEIAAPMSGCRPQWRRCGGAVLYQRQHRTAQGRDAQPCQHCSRRAVPSPPAYRAGSRNRRADLRPAVSRRRHRARRFRRMMAAGALSILPRFDAAPRAANVIEQRQGHRARVRVPTMLRMMLEHPDCGRRDLIEPARDSVRRRADAAGVAGGVARGDAAGPLHSQLWHDRDGIELHDACRTRGCVAERRRPGKANSIGRRMLGSRIVDPGYGGDRTCRPARSAKSSCAARV